MIADLGKFVMRKTRTLPSRLLPFRWCFVLLCVTVSIGCGGGGGGSSTPTPTNSAPQITSAATFSLVEGETNIGSVTASDIDNDTLSYSVSGTDASAVIITSSGMLSFVSAPDYETKASYSITVTVSDGTASTTQTITISITSNPELGGNYTNNPDLSGQFLDAVLVNRNPDCRAYVADANGDYGYYVTDKYPFTPPCTFGDRDPSFGKRSPTLP